MFVKNRFQDAAPEECQNFKFSERERDSKTRPNLCAKDRRRAIMTMPRGSGYAVLVAFDKRAGAGVLQLPADREAFLQQELERLVAARWRADCERLCLAVTPHVPAESVVPQAASLADMEAWYRKTYNAQAERDAQISAQDWTGGFH